MVYRFLRWLRGYLYIQLAGSSTERFINLCRNHKIVIWKITQNEDGCFCYMHLRDYRNIRHIARKTRIMPYVRKRFGLPFWIVRMKKKKIFVAGIGLFLFFLYVFSSHVWSITISGEERYTDEQILKYLRTIGIRGGMWCRDVDCQGIEEAIRGNYNDIGWVSAELKGTYLRIQLLENKLVSTDTREKKPVHIVAAHAGTVQSIVTKRGTPLVHKGDVVKKGDILISGVVEVVGDNDVIVDKQAVDAEGEVTLATSYSYEDTIALLHKKRMPTGRTFRLWSFDIGDYRFYLYNPIKKFETFTKYDIMMSGDSVKLGDLLSLPVAKSCKEYIEVTEQEEKYKDEEALLLAKRHYDRYLEKLEENSVVVMRDTLTYKVTDTKCIAKGKVFVQEPQTKHRKVKKDEWRMEETDEPDGDNDRDSDGT